MSLRRAQIEALLAEFRALLPDGRLQALRQHGPGRFSLELYRQQRYFFWLDLERPQSLCFLTHELPPAADPSALTLALRKHLLGSRLSTIEQLGTDRILSLDWQGEQTHRLVLELSSRHANLFLLDAQHTVLQQLYPDHSQRGLRRGTAYVLPPPRQWPAESDSLELAALPADGSRSQAVQSAYRQQSSLAAQARLIGQGLAALRRRLARARQELERLQADLDGLDEAGLYQRRGELLQSAFGQVSRGQSEARVIDYFDPEQPEIAIPLDPAKDLAANIQRCFQLSRKRERAAERALELLDAAEARVHSLEADESELSALAVTADNPLAPELLERFSEQIGPARSQPAKRAAAERLPYREFVSAAGQRILVGRSARDNDQLTFCYARGNDLWLHVRDWSGSHVVVPLAKGEQVHPETLLDAATLALHYSSAKTDAGPLEQAEVNYTLRKHVQKFKGAHPGQVHLQEFKVLNLRLEQARLQRLMADG
ncbi:MAG TPA: NFACT RNA binding domain-containing protein [Candidatus Obscuribacterales bacterium]